MTLAPVDPARFEEMYRDERTRPWAARRHTLGYRRPAAGCPAAGSAGRDQRRSARPGHRPGTPRDLLRLEGLLGHRHRRLTAGLERAGRTRQSGGVGELPAGRRHELEGLDNRFDTVVDCAFYHTFSARDRDFSCPTRRRCTGPPSPARGCTCSSSASATSTVSGCCGRCPRTISAGASGRRLGDHLPGADHLPGEYERRDIRDDGRAESRHGRPDRRRCCNGSGRWSRGWSTAAYMPGSGKCTPPGWTGRPRCLSHCGEARSASPGLSVDASGAAPAPAAARSS